MKCYDTYPCIQLYSVFDNGTLKGESFFKGCTIYRACEEFNKGNITKECYYPFAKCKGKCCYGEECNKGDILDITGHAHDSSKSSVKALATSGLGLVFGLLLTIVSVN